MQMYTYIYVYTYVYGLDSIDLFLTPPPILGGTQGGRNCSSHMCHVPFNNLATHWVKQSRPPAGVTIEEPETNKKRLCFLCFV